jgi:hypothetical protein
MVDRPPSSLSSGLSNNNSTPPPPVEVLTRGMISLFNRFAPVNENSNGSSSGVHLSQSTSHEKAGTDEKTKAYKDFIANLKTLGEETPELVKRIGDFLDRINKKEIINKYPIFDDEDVPGCHEEFADDVRIFLERQGFELANTRFWKTASDAELINMREHLERLVMSKLHDHVFAPTESHRARDDQLALKISKLQIAIDPIKHLDVKVDLNPRQIDAEKWNKAAEELRKMNSFKTPREKITCVTNASRIITQIIKSKGETPIPDVFIPCLVYIVILANPKSLHSNVEYLAGYRGPEFMRDERGHFFLHFASAVSFIWRSDAKALSMSSQEFEDAMTLDLDVQDAPISPQREMNGQDISVPTEDWFEMRFQFEHLDEATIKVSEIPRLLQEYKLLVQGCRALLQKSNQ